MNYFRCFVILMLFLPFSTQAEETQLNWVGCGISKKSYLTALAKAYQHQNPVKINIQGGGATRGIRDVAKEKADFGGSCRYHLPGNSLEMSVGYEPVAWDALAVIVNKANPVKSITTQQVRDIYLGKIKNWKQLGGNDAPLHLFVRKGKISGVGYTIRKLIFADLDQDFKASKTFKSSGPVEKGVVEDSNAIAITGISSARLRPVKILELNNKAPNYENIKSGQYVLYRPLYLTYNPESPHIKEVKDFIEFAHSAQGREIMKQNHVVPYLEALRLVLKQARQDLQAQQNSDEEITYKN